MSASSHLPCQTSLPATPVDVFLLPPHAQGVLSGVLLLSLGVTKWQEAGSRTGWALLVLLSVP